MPRIFISRAVPESAMALLRDAFGEAAVDVYEIDQVIPRDELLCRIRGADALLAILTERIDAELFEAAGPQLRIVANMAVGYDNIDVPAATARGIPVTNTPGVLTETTADLAWALILAASRRLGEGERYLRDGRWKSWGPLLLLGFDVHGKTLGIFGMGRIGQAVARRARAFNMRVIYHDPTPLCPALEQSLEAAYVDIPALLAESDILTVHCPLTPQTRHAFGREQFQAMKCSAVFINTARGPVVDEAALAEALRTRQIFAAGLDVFEAEPAIHPDLLQCENAVLLPHLGSATLETRSAMANIAARNIIARLHGERPPNCLNPETLDA